MTLRPQTAADKAEQVRVGRINHLRLALALSDNLAAPFPRDYDDRTVVSAAWLADLLEAAVCEDCRPDPNPEIVATLRELGHPQLRGHP